MSEFLRDSGHNNMRTCDDCGGAFYCGDAADRGEDAPDWTCETCTTKDSVIKALADALEKAREFVHGRGNVSKSVREEGDAALRLAGRL